LISQDWADIFLIGKVSHRSTMTAKEFGQLIRQGRQALGLTQRDLAQVIDTGERFVVELEAGKGTSQLGKALAAAHAVGMRISAPPKGAPGRDRLDTPRADPMTGGP
jgi:HTH-type transcriptional regulator/antitoxin HipB